MRIGIGSQVPRPAVAKLKTQEALMVSFASEGRKNLILQLKGSESRGIPPSLRES